MMKRESAKYSKKQKLFMGTMAVALLSPALLTGNELQYSSLSAIELQENATPVEVIDTYAQSGDNVTIYGQVIDVNKASGNFVVRGVEGATISVNVVGAPGVMYGDQGVVNGDILQNASSKEINGKNVYVTNYAID